MLLETLFTKRKNNDKYNTSYPLDPAYWRPFKIKQALDFSYCPELSFYIHIPFCQHLCHFCEYKRMATPSHCIQKKYLNGIKQDIDLFLCKYPDIILRGFDIGGGTPTALDDECFEFLMDIYIQTIKKVQISDDFEPSIEATFQTLDLNKIEMIAKAGINRLSLGIQTTVKSVQDLNGRFNPEISDMSNIISDIKKSGIKKINLDLMYGLEGQTINDIDKDLECIKNLSPEQVTLYELRTNMIGGTYKASQKQLFNMYCKLYQGLKSLGYYSDFGQNTFSKNRYDLGLSSYLKSRMIDFLPYKGFGLSAQSMSFSGISYNTGKLDPHIRTIIEQNNNYPEEDIYLLPESELLSKYIAISAYYGRFSINVANRILGKDFIKTFSEEINYCLQNGYVNINDSQIVITRKGFEYYGAVFSLFYSRFQLTSAS